MIRVKLREAMSRESERSGERITYALLAKRTGISVETLQSLAVRPSYNTRLSTVDRLCQALNCSPGELLEFEVATRQTVGAS